MNLPPHGSSYSILLGRPWLHAATVMHDWKNSTLMLQSQDGVVKVDLRDWKVRPVIPRGLEPSSSASTTTHTSIDSQIPSELSSNYVMNWMEALATIDFLMVGIETPLEEIDKVPTTRSLEEIPLPETPKEMLRVFKDNELREERNEEGILHLSYLAEVEKPKETTLRKEEAKAKHNIPKRRETNRVLMEHLSEEELKAKLLEDADQDPIPWRDVPQYFKDYTMDEVVIVMPQAVRPSQVEEEPSSDIVYKGPARMREINLAQEEESDKLKQLLVEDSDCFTWIYEDLKGIDENIVVHIIPLRVDAVPATQRPYRNNPRIAQTL